MGRSEVFFELRRNASLSAIQCPGLLSPWSLVGGRVPLFPIATVCEELALVSLGSSGDQIGKACLPDIAG